MGHSDTENKLFLFLVLCSEFSTLIILNFGFEGWQLWPKNFKYEETPKKKKMKESKYATKQDLFQD